MKVELVAHPSGVVGVAPFDENGYLDDGHDVNGDYFCGTKMEPLLDLAEASGNRVTRIVEMSEKLIEELLSSDAAEQPMRDAWAQKLRLVTENMKLSSKTAAVDYGVSTPASSLVSLLGLVISLSHRTQEAHWNVKGEHFGPLHELFGDFYAFLLDFSDTVAERIVQQGGIATASNDGEPIFGDATTLLQKITTDANVLAVGTKTLQGSCGEDKVTEDILIEYGRELEKWVWKIESHLTQVAKVAAKQEAPLEIGDIVTDPRAKTLTKNKIKYEVVGLLEDGKVRLHPLNGGLGDFTHPSSGLVVVTPKNPRSERAPKPHKPYVDPAKKYVDKIVNELEKYCADMASEVYQQFSTDVEDAKQDFDVDDVIHQSVHDAVLESLGKFHVPESLWKEVQIEATNRLHYPGGRV
jgi:starvation-inducible DNA-binding protein